MAKLDIAKLAERLAQLSKPSGGGNLSYLNLKDGRNVVRVLPASKTAEMFYEEAWLHYGIGKSEQNKKGSVVVCPTTAGDHMKCPVCELVKELRSLSKNKEDKYAKEAQSLSRKKRVYFNAIDRSDDLSAYTKGADGKWSRTTAEGTENSSPIKILASGVGIFKDLLGIMVDPEYGDVTDPTEGLDLIITKTGTGFNTEYDVKTVRKNSDVGFDEWEENLNDLTGFTKHKTYDEIVAILSGEEPTKDEPAEATKAEAVKEVKKADPVESTGDDLQDEIKAALARRGAR